MISSSDNSSHLEHIVIKTLPDASDSGPDSYPRLKSLVCNYFKLADAKACPALRSIVCHGVDGPNPELRTITLANLENLKVNGEEIHDDFAAFIWNHASTLVECDFAASSLPSSPTVVYEKLQTLKCNPLTSEAAGKIPAIKSLELDFQITGDLDGLPEQELRSFVVRGALDHHNWPMLLSKISRMSNLTKLSLSTCGRAGSWVLMDVPDLFAYMHHLQEVFLHVGSVLGDDATQIRMLIRLAENNPNLAKIELGSTPLSEEVISRFALLEKLTSINLFFSRATENMLLTLLRGRSRQSFRTFRAYVLTRALFDQVNSEIEIIAAERGVSFQMLGCREAGNFHYQFNE